MHWQDYVITAGAAIFCVALLPSVIAKDSKPALSTSISTGTIGLIFAFTFSTLHLWFSTITEAICGLLWLLLAWQKFQLDRQKGGGGGKGGV